VTKRYRQTEVVKDLKLQFAKLTYSEFKVKLSFRKGSSLYTLKFFEKMLICNMPWWEYQEHKLTD